MLRECAEDRESFPATIRVISLVVLTLSSRYRICLSSVMSRVKRVLPPLTRKDEAKEREVTLTNPYRGAFEPPQ
jgi:hypothetical protein